MRTKLIFAAFFIGGFLLGALLATASGMLAGRSLGDGTYYLTEYVTAAYSPRTAIMVVAIAFTVGLVFRSGYLAFASGVTFVPCAAFLVEVSRDSTSHNLWPIGAVMYWLPIFLLAAAGGWIGSRLSRRNRSDDGLLRVNGP